MLDLRHKKKINDACHFNKKQALKFYLSLKTITFASQNKTKHFFQKQYVC